LRLKPLLVANCKLAPSNAVCRVKKRQSHVAVEAALSVKPQVQNWIKLRVYLFARVKREQAAAVAEVLCIDAKELSLMKETIHRGKNQI
jgi:Holliday junction resolvase-like predicted endonuclease